jgi:hypothetical protein
MRKIDWRCHQDGEQIFLDEEACRTRDQDLEGRVLARTGGQGLSVRMEIQLCQGTGTRDYSWIRRRDERRILRCWVEQLLSICQWGDGDNYRRDEEGHYRLTIMQLSTRIRICGSVLVHLRRSIT